MTGQSHYSTRQAAYDIRKLRAKGLLAKLERSRRYHVPPGAADYHRVERLVRDQVMNPILAGVRSPRQGRKPSTWTTVDRYVRIPTCRDANPLRSSRYHHDRPARRGIDNNCSGAGCRRSCW